MIDKIFIVKGKRVNLTLSPASRYGFKTRKEALKEAKYLKERYSYHHPSLAGGLAPVKITQSTIGNGKEKITRYYVWW